MTKKLPSNIHAKFNTRTLSGVFSICFALCLSTAFAQPAVVAQLPSGSKNFTYVNGSLYYSVADNVYKASPTLAPVLVKTTGETILRIYDITVGSTFFFVTQGGAGERLWRSDGTAANTLPVVSGLQITPLVSYHSQLIFRMATTALGNELWKLDATYTPAIIKDISAGAGNGFAGSLIVHNDLLYFFGNNGSETDLWKSDGTTASTIISVDLDDTEVYNSSNWYGLTSVNSVMFFTRNYEGNDYGDRYAELWKTDGTAANTSMVVQYTNGYFYNYISDLVAFKGKLYFFHSFGDPQYHYISVSDGTAAGTRHLDLTSIDGAPRELINAGDYILFYAESQGFTTPIEKSDGTTITTVHQFSMYHSTSDQFIDLTYTGGRAFFLDSEGDYYGTDSELWQADLSTGVTRTVRQIYDISLSNSGNIVAAEGAIYFTRVVAGEMSLWYYNPDAPPISPVCAGIGSIEREKWLNITGYGVSTIPVNTEPNTITKLTSFSTPRNEGDNYGSRVRGFLCIPESGNYVFYISGDDNTELWLSTDDNPANKKLIASSKWTNYNEWTKYPSQQSAEIYLAKGTKYYIEALHKEASGADHLAVGWRLPNGTLERPINGVRLIPYTKNAPPSVEIINPTGETYTAPATVNIEAAAEDSDGSIVKVSFFANEKYLGEDLTAPYTFQWQNVPAGNYTLEARARDNEGNTKSAFESVPVNAPPPCAGTGNIFQEFWLNVAGTDVRAFDFSTTPNGGIRNFSTFETGQYYANNYASRMRAYLCVPQSGNYTFWISSDDGSELYLSSDESEVNKKLIASVYGSTPFRNYDKYPSQKSVQISLEAGRKYYIEARHKEGNGNDFISVGWQLPDGTLQRPIAGSHLIAIEPFIPCFGVGRIYREIWFGIPGTSVSSIPVNTPPHTTVQLTSLSTPNYYGNDYGSRIRGYVCAPSTGAYTFWISGDDNSELWLSDSEDPANKQRIAYVTGATSVNQWDKYSTQMSAAINLTQGHRYYIEVLHKEGNGADHVEVGWKLPGGALERPIPDTRIMPFGDASTHAAAEEFQGLYEVEQSANISVYPNPAQAGKQLSIALPDGFSGEVAVDILSATGISVQAQNLPTHSGTVVLDLKPSIASGIYLIKVSSKTKRWSQKLQIE